MSAATQMTDSTWFPSLDDDHTLKQHAVRYENLLQEGTGLAWRKKVLRMWMKKHRLWVKENDQ